MTKHTLKVSPRELAGRKVKTLRSKGILPANIFGKDLKSLNVSVDTKTIQKLYAQIGESTLLYLEVEKEKESRPVFIRQFVKNPVTGLPLHASFNQVNLKEKVLAPVPLELVGIAPAEQEKLGIMVQQLQDLEVFALPTDMPENIQVDISALTSEGSAITVGDLKLDSKLEVKTDPETIVVKIEALAKEEVEPVVAPAAEGAPVEEAKAGESTPEKSPEDKKEETK